MQRLATSATPHDFCGFGATETRSVHWPIYTIDDHIAVDFVGRLERLADDLEEVFARLELHHPPLPHAKRMRPSASYRNWYRNDERSLVERLANDPPVRLLLKEPGYAQR